MNLHRPGAKAVAAAFALTLLVAACGGDDDSPDDPPETTATTAADSTTSTTDDEGTTESTEAEEEGPDVEEAQALAESINLTIDDFADGWESEPADEDDDDELYECFQDTDIADVEVAQSDSPTFSISTDDGERGQVVQTTTIVTDDEESGEAVIAEIGTNQFAGCAEDILIASGEEDGGSIETTGIDVVEDQGGLGDEAIGLAGDITYVAPNDSEAEGQLAYYFIRTENVVTGVSILDIGDVAFQDTLADLLAEVAGNQEREIG